MATRLNAHEERLATLNSVMNVIAVLDQSAPRRSVSDRWLDLRALMPAQDAGMELDETWQEFLVRPAQAGPHQAPMEHE